MQNKRAVEIVALASEIMQLPNREGFVKRATSPEWRFARFAFIDYPTQMAGFELDDAARSKRRSGNDTG